MICKECGREMVEGEKVLIVYCENEATINATLPCMRCLWCGREMLSAKMLQNSMRSVRGVFEKQSKGA